MDIQQLMELAVQQGASDLHLLVDTKPTLRIHGKLVAVEQAPVLTNQIAQNMALSLMSETQRQLFINNKELDFSFQYLDKARFRVNAYFQRANASLALRLINSKIQSVEELKLPAVCHEITKLKQGFVLVTGPTGSGKSTSLAAMIEEINQSRAEHIITIEDPIEYLYQQKKSIISQREMNQDTHSWSVALKSVLREDPNVVLVGEMRDYETIAAALTVAETGHLVLATLHTNSAAQTVDRIIDVFPENQQPQVRNQLAMSLEAVFAQRLIPAVAGGRIPVMEVMLATAAIRNTIREGKAYQIDNIIQTSGAMGMMTLEASLAYWVKAGAISFDVAREYALKPEELNRLMSKQAEG